MKRSAAGAASAPGRSAGSARLDARQHADQFGGIVALAVEIGQCQQIAHAARSLCHRAGDRSVECLVQLGLSGGGLHLERHFVWRDVERQPDVHQR